MTFFEQQHQARQETRKLVFLFALAVIAIVLAVNLAMALLWNFKFGGHHEVLRSYPKGFFAINTLITLALIGGGTLIQTFNLRDGGDAVALMAGGRLIAPASGDLQERRLLNVVEEMALASGIACPKVYLLEHEDAINAFAAGYNQNEAVVAVTRGTLNRLTRDELQGVVGHEFSHILNGDMRLNVHLIGVLFGIQMIAGFGQQLMNIGRFSGSSRDDKGPPWQLVMLFAGANSWPTPVPSSSPAIRKASAAPCARSAASPTATGLVRKSITRTQNSCPICSSAAYVPTCWTAGSPPIRR